VQEHLHPLCSRKQDVVNECACLCQHHTHRERERGVRTWM
jgi:hypothetical protein